MENVIYEFYGEKCVPCRMIAKKIVELTEKYKEIVPIIKVSTDDGSNKYLMDKYDITSVPTAVVIKDGYEIEKFFGTAIPKLLEETLRKEFLTENT